MDIGKAFGYVFEDEQWVAKLLIGALLLLASIIPGVNLFTALAVAGYTIRAMRNVSDGKARPLPEWNDWGGDWVRGALTILAGLIYALPALLLAGVNLGITAVAAPEGEELRGAALACFLSLQCLAIFWSVLIALWMPAATLRFARKETFGAFFELGAIWQFIREHLGDYIVALVVASLAKVIAGFGVLLCFIGVYATGLWAALVMSHLLGQIGAAPLQEAAVASPGPVAPTTYGELVEAPPSSADEPQDKA